MVVLTEMPWGLWLRRCSCSGEEVENGVVLWGALEQGGRLFGSRVVYRGSRWLPLVGSLLGLLRRPAGFLCALKRFANRLQNRPGSC